MAPHRSGTDPRWAPSALPPGTASTATTVGGQAGRRSSELTADQEAALREAGSFVEQLPAVSDRASTRTALRAKAIEDDSKTSREVAELLGISARRVRQRATEGTLFAIRREGIWRFPAFQFPNDSELPGWGRIAPAFGRDTSPVAVESFLGRPHVDLMVDGEQTSPVAWLASGHAPGAVAALVRGTFDGLS